MTNAASALALGGITFLLTVIWGGPLIRIMRRLKIGEQISIEGPQRHTMKLGTPTMGGWLFIIPVLLITGVLNLVSIASELNVFGNSILLPMITLLLFALVGAWDDWLGIKRPRGVGGMRARWNAGDDSAKLPGSYRTGDLVHTHCDVHHHRNKQCR